LRQPASVKQHLIAFALFGWLFTGAGASKRATVYVYNAQFLESLKLYGSQLGLIACQPSISAKSLSG